MYVCPRKSKCCQKYSVKSIVHLLFHHGHYEVHYMTMAREDEWKFLSNWNHEILYPPSNPGRTEEAKRELERDKSPILKRFFSGVSS